MININERQNFDSVTELEDVSTHVTNNINPFIKSVSSYAQVQWYIFKYLKKKSLRYYHISAFTIK